MGFYELIIPSFIAGVLTFLAPCTLPLVPGYLGFISGLSSQELNKDDSSKHVKNSRGQIMANAVYYVLGFSIVFIILGSLFGLGGAALAQYRPVLSRVGGFFVIFFGLYMLRLFELPGFNLLAQDHHLNLTQKLKPGTPISSLVFGATFAFGWSPCVGPILGSVFLLASSTATVGQGAALLAVFSIGLGIPFLLIAASLSSANTVIKNLHKYLRFVTPIGGIFLVFLGILLITNNFGNWLNFFYHFFKFIKYDHLLNYL